VWIINDNNRANAVEIGFFSGAGAPGSTFYTTAILPYYTLDNGQLETDGVGINLPTNTGMALSVSNQDSVNNHLFVGNSSRVYWSPTVHYAISQPLRGFMQGEVNCHDVTMGGGVGENFQMYWQGANSNWYLWGYMSNFLNCPDYNYFPCPYWLNQVSGSYWTNGGYGAYGFG
jgi:hypothetical protein